MTDWDQRTLCPDGACVGVIGPDGTCKVCGRVAPNWGEERKRGLIEEPSDEEDEELEDDEESTDEEQAEGEESPEWEDRKLCPDGSCVGVIGPNGTCNVCGRSAA
ncbi:MAG: hypothetical protein HOV81_11125 [Kofleriaceae bacterium]|nr:hypothetical protein [Kofleriaceae bacterium]